MNSRLRKSCERITFRLRRHYTRGLPYLDVENRMENERLKP